MVIRDDHVEAVVTRPMKRCVSPDATVHTDDQFVTFGDCFFECGLLNAVAFGETVRDVEDGASAKQFQSAQKDRRARYTVDVVVTVNQNWFLSVNRLLEARYCLLHAEHQVRFVKLVVVWSQKSPRGRRIGVSAVD